MKPITGYKEFFAVLDKIDSDMEKYRQQIREEGKDDFFGGATYDADIPAKGSRKFKDNVHLRIGKKSYSSNGREKVVDLMYLWRTEPNYMGKATAQQVWEKSDRKKILHSENGLDFCIIRDYLREPTKTYWGRKFETKVGNKYYPHKLALMKGNNVLFSCVERWEFEQYCTQVEEEETRMPETPSEIFRYFNPFRVHTIPMNQETEGKINDLCSEFDWGINTPFEIHTELVGKGYYKDDELKDKWLIVLHGLTGHGFGRSYGTHSTMYYDRSATWWMMTSKTKPTVDEALYHVMQELDFYVDGCDSDQPYMLMDLLEKMKNDFEYDLNKINIRAYQRVQDLYSRKLRWSLAEVMGVEYKELKEFWNENIRY